MGAPARQFCRAGVDVVYSLERVWNMRHGVGSWNPWGWCPHIGRWYTKTLGPFTFWRSFETLSRTTLSPLLPTLYLGSPLHSGHALPSPLSSLLPTLSFPCGSNKSPCKEEIVGVEDSGLTWGDGVDALWERSGDPSTGEWSERAGDRRLDRTRL